MNENDYRRQIGEKLKEVYLSQPIGETPSKETFDKWIEIAGQKRIERRHRRKKLAICVIVLVICVALGAACIFDPLQAEADGKDGSTIERGLGTSDVHQSYEELSDEVEDEFLMAGAEDLNYSLVEMQMKTIEAMEVLIITYKDKEKENNQLIGRKGKPFKSRNLRLTDAKAELVNCEGTGVYIRQYINSGKKRIYTFLYNNLAIRIGAASKVQASLVLKKKQK